MVGEILWVISVVVLVGELVYFSLFYDRKHSVYASDSGTRAWEISDAQKTQLRREAIEAGEVANGMFSAVLSELIPRGKRSNESPRRGSRTRGSVNLASHRGRC